MVQLTRQVTFTAGHIYRGNQLSTAELDTLFGIASEPSGHGHNYVLEVTIAGQVASRDGMVINIKDLDRILRELLKPIDHRMLNIALPEFADAVPTTERLAQALWRRLPAYIEQTQPIRLRLEEHPGMYITLEGADPEMIYLTRSVEFAAAHRLHSVELNPDENKHIYGKCNNPNGHGHNYVVEVTVCGKPDARTGIVINLGTLEELLEQKIENYLDHKHLNLDIPEFKTLVPTAENIAKVIWNLLAPEIKSCRADGKVELYRVRLIETARSWFDYFGS
jgi:6-pyruvoyltetrahydropterin/6-carboxytetrahydropterin synthase